MSVVANDAVAAALEMADINWNDDQPQPEPEAQTETVNAAVNGDSDEQSNDFAYIQENEEGDWLPVGDAQN